jgi:hypothetical protein
VTATTLFPASPDAPFEYSSDRARPRRRRLPASWPLTAMFAFYPLWWILGIGAFMFPILAVPMVHQLRKRGKIRAPKGFGLWMLFILWMLAGVFVLGVNAPNTLPGQYSTRFISFAYRALMYLAATVVLLYIGNMPEKELPTRRVTRNLGFLFVVTVAGGFLGILVPLFQFKSPLAYVIPHGLMSNDFVSSTVFPHSSQVQKFLGYNEARPSAPFDYTNEWGANLSFFLPFFVCGWLLKDSNPGWRRKFAVPIIVLSIIPIVYSLNRGLWIGLIVVIAYLAFRLAAMGRIWLVQALGVALALGAAIFLASPLHGLVQDRLAHPHSNERRSFLAVQAVQGAASSPFLGYGTTRPAIGSDQSIAAGKSASCPHCGTPPIGTHGHLWLLIYSQGFIGAAFFLGFFVRMFWRYRRDRSPLSIAGCMCIILFVIDMFIYNEIPSPILVIMASMGLMWRASEQRKAAVARPRPRWQESPPVPGRLALPSGR